MKKKEIERVTDENALKLRRPQFSKAESELQRILEWFEENPILTAEECVFKLSIADPTERIERLRQLGYMIHETQVVVITDYGGLGCTSVYVFDQNFEVNGTEDTQLTQWLSQLRAIDRRSVTGANAPPVFVTASVHKQQTLP